MALTQNTRDRGWQRLHLLGRLVGMTAFLTAVVGLFLVSLEIKVRDRAQWQGALESLFRGQREPAYLWWGLILLLAGGLIVILATVVEAIVFVRRAAGRRGLVGGSVTLQIGLALVLLIGVNVFAFQHYDRFDWTRDHRFTLDQNTRRQLKQLRGETTVVLYQRHNALGKLAGKTVSNDLVYPLAAEREVAAKVKDLVEQFSDLGATINLIELDITDPDFEDKFDKVKQAAPELAAAIDSAPESSVFFFASGGAGGKVQRLAFTDLYQLDMVASQAAGDRKGNLVLASQGMGPFTRKILNIEEKRPKVALAVIHEILSSEGNDEYGMAGVKKALEAQGFEVVDLLLKKWNEFGGPPEAAAMTTDENTFERLEGEIAEMEANRRSYEEDQKKLTDTRNLWKNSTLDELTKKYADQLREGQKIDEPLRRRQLANLELNLQVITAVLTQLKTDLAETIKQKEALNKGQSYADRIAEQRRLTDLKAKMDRMLVDCDLLIVPRMTLRNVASREYILSRLYRLDNAQVDAIKDFLKAGKPILACFGPNLESPNDVRNMQLNQMIPPGPDALEQSLEQLGFRMPRETVLFNVESKAFADRRSGFLGTGAKVDVPPVEFDWPAGSERPATEVGHAHDKPAHPLRESMTVTANSAGRQHDIRLRNPRPIYFDDKAGASLAYDPNFMVTNPAGWNEDQPFASGNEVPRFKPPKRLGRFPIGAAVEVTVPESWYDKGARPETTRVAVIGQGGLFTGATLTPAKEKLLLDTCNWLLGRDDLLSRGVSKWEFPRVQLATQNKLLWDRGAWLGWPLFFTFLGFVVLIVRRLR